MNIKGIRNFLKVGIEKFDRSLGKASCQRKIQSMVITSRVLLKNSPKSLYKYLLRECEKLPQGANEFYKHSIRQSFKQHVNEPDPERVQHIMEKALLDAKWIMQKYKKDSTPDPPKK